MAFQIQRPPRGLANVLSLQTGDTPRTLDTNVHGTIDLLQMYGLTQLQVGRVNAAALAEAAAVNLFLAGGAAFTTPGDVWTVLFGVFGFFTKTATMTALTGEVYVNRVGSSTLLQARELGPFGATETGQPAVGLWMPYPLVCPPGSSVSAVPSIIGTDATAAVSVLAEFGVLG